MLRTLIVIVLVVFGMQAIAQNTITWQTLSDIRFTDKYSEEVDAYFYYPHFGPSVQALEGTEVVIKGYMLVFDKENEMYILSKNPYASCFFCGNAGPESIIELNLKPDHPDFKMDQFVTIRGILALNAEDIYHCNYILKDAELHHP